MSALIETEVMQFTTEHMERAAHKVWLMQLECGHERGGQCRDLLRRAPHVFVQASWHGRHEVQCRAEADLRLRVLNDIGLREDERRADLR
eukprot:7020448-Heterocapsa_arctica.AAC.1